jgi:hypothetical protein
MQNDAEEQERARDHARRQCLRRRRTGGEQAANALQLDGSSRYATTAETKVGATLAALLLVKGGRCLHSHGRNHRGLQGLPHAQGHLGAGGSRSR